MSRDTHTHTHTRARVHTHSPPPYSYSPASGASESTRPLLCLLGRELEAEKESLLFTKHSIALFPRAVPWPAPGPGSPRLALGVFTSTKHTPRSPALGLRVQVSMSMRKFQAGYVEPETHGGAPSTTCSPLGVHLSRKLYAETQLMARPTQEGEAGWSSHPRPGASCTILPGPWSPP